MTTFQKVVMFAIQALAVGLGGYCLMLLLKKARNQALIAFHLLAGLGGIEVLLGVIHMSDLDADSPVRALGILAAKFFAVAAVAGAFIPLVGFAGKGRPQLVNLLLAIHVSSALLGFFASFLFARQI
jgi:hypothetical protein